jgi:hypothetical protein
MKISQKSRDIGQEGLGGPILVRHISNVRYLLPYHVIFAKIFVSTPSTSIDRTPTVMAPWLESATLSRPLALTRL